MAFVSQPLRPREPQALFAPLALLLAGPLNPLALLLFVGDAIDVLPFETYGSGEMVLLLICWPATVGSLMALWLRHRAPPGTPVNEDRLHSERLFRSFALAFAFVAAASPILLSIAMTVVGFVQDGELPPIDGFLGGTFAFYFLGLLTLILPALALGVGVPAAVAAWFTTRVVAFQWRPEN